MSLVHISQAIRELVERWKVGPHRHPVARLGEREPIPWFLRLSILRRDDYRCKICGSRDESGATLELDHCLPWSAGGPDDSDNLRTLCRPCNQRRSNFDDGAELIRLLPTTWWCQTCWAEPTPRRTWSDGTNLGVVPPVAEQSVLAWCAYCEAVDYTDQPISGDWRTRLAGVAVTEVIA